MKHEYASAGSYLVYAEIGRWNGKAIKPITGFKPKISITPPPLPLQLPHDGLPDVGKYWWGYLAIGLSVFFVVYRVWKSRIPIRPTFQLHPDLGTARLMDGANLAMGFKIRLNPNVAGGQYGLRTNEASLIRSRRKMND